MTVPASITSSSTFPAGETSRFFSRSLALLEEVGNIVGGTGDYGGKLSRALERIADCLGMARGSISLLSPGGHDIYVEIAYGLKPVELSRGHYTPGEGVTGLVIQSGQAMAVPDVLREPRFLNRTRARNLQRESLAFYCVPLKVEDEAIGALAVERRLPAGWGRSGRGKSASSSAFSSAGEGCAEDMLRLLGVLAALLAPCARKHQEARSSAASSTQNGGTTDDDADAFAQAPRRAGRKEGAGSDGTLPRLVGNTPALQVVLAQVRQVAPSTATVLVLGESGTGKELVAQAIHKASPRRDKPFISLNCAALPDNLLESELFGHERGAFTGAASSRKGRFELAEGGTIFLDEVGDLALVTQAKLLRILQERTFERLGGMETRKADVRVIAATNRVLEDMVEAGTFRRDLYYRLHVFPIRLPPLRERKNDILLLAQHFVERFAVVNGKESVRLSLTVMDMLHRHNWPGNVRELENIMERAVLLVGRDGLILPQHLPPDLHSEHCPIHMPARPDGLPADFAPDDCTLQERLEELERSCIVNALERHEGHLGRAAVGLGLTERVMALRMRKYGIRYQNFRPGRN